ncbi:MAG TPA: peptidoglycan-binding protein [Actinomycetota bacterium]|nr:peptidoglycan-binding protein [Actinomycetota bacterium]
MATSAKEVLAKAKDQVGISDGGSNNNKFTQWYPMPGQPWCAMFVSWVFHHSGLENIPKFAYTPSFADWFRQQGAGFDDDADAQPGDVVFFNFPDSVDRIQHVGLVLENQSGKLKTIEGNTSSGAGGSQDDGEVVAIRERGYGEAVYYGRPDYNGKPKKPRFDFPVKEWFGKGDSGADVKRWQRDLNRWCKVLNEERPEKATFMFEIDVDGKFGKDTEKATMTFQGFYDLEADGRVGTKTLEKMERVRDNQRERAKA